jgi:ADP-ribose pyrophosphatase
MRALSSRIAFRGRVIQIAMRRYRREDGEEYERDVVEHPGAVGILAHHKSHVYLVSQPREAIGAEASLEIPAGTIDPDDESPLACAMRELAEEVGLAAESWSELRSIAITTGYSDERVWLFEATGLTPASAEPGEDERIEVVRLPLDELDAAIERIEDAKSLIALEILRRRAAPHG